MTPSKNPTRFNFKPLLPHLLVVLGFIVLSVGYMSPVLKGKVLVQNDPMQAAAAAHEAVEYTKKTGEWTGWTNSMFGGMPTYFIGGHYSKGAFFYMGKAVIGFLGSGYANFIFYYLLGMYILLLVLECGLPTSVLGAIAYAFFSYNIMIIEAGHISKVYALAFAPLMIAGLIMAFKGRRWAGAALFGLGMGLDLNANHVQITYYTALLIAIFGIFELVRAVRHKELAGFITAGVLAAVLGGLATATQAGRLLVTYEYTKETIRGKSDLVAADKTKPAGDGLDRDYAFNWSYGKLESLTLLIPNFSGGASNGELDEKSDTYKKMLNYNVPPEQASQFVRSLPGYWGDQTSVSGGTYSGAILCFLFVLGLFLADKRYKYPFAITGLLFLMIAWGENLAFYNYFLFDHFPMFNKFRAVSMILSLVQLCMVVVAALGLKNILETKPTWAQIKTPFLVSLGLTAGLALILAIVPSLVGLRSVNDPELIKNLSNAFGNNQNAATDLYKALLDDRASLLRADAFRSFFFIVLAAGLLWAFITQKIKNTMAVTGILAFLVLVDLWTVDKRFLSNDDFKPKFYSTDDLFQPSPANLQIMADTDPNFRVIDLSTSIFGDAKPSYFHKSLGGYHGAKLKRYDELVQNQVSKNNMAVFNMLNTKYFITPDKDNQPVVQRNPEALGNAWFVRELKVVADANEEMKALDKFDPRQVAFVDKRFVEQIKGFSAQADTTAKIRLTDYKPNHLTYESDSRTPQAAIFSEIYYRGNEDWLATIDGQSAPHFRANYVLRGLIVPAGKHKIEFKFDPPTVKKGQTIDLWASIGWILLTGLALVMDFRRKV